MLNTMSPLLVMGDAEIETVLDVLFKLEIIKKFSTWQIYVMNPWKITVSVLFPFCVECPALQISYCEFLSDMQVNVV
jgi:hypothetical protein